MKSKAAIKAAQSVTDKPLDYRGEAPSSASARRWLAPASRTARPLGADNVKKTKEFYGFNPDETFAGACRQCTTT